VVSFLCIHNKILLELTNQEALDGRVCSAMTEMRSTYKRLVGEPEEK
jgi:hypothetical protein